MMLVLILLLNACTTKDQKTNHLNSAAAKEVYLGQKPPGLTAEVFTPNTSSKEGWELGEIHKPDMEEFYFTSSLGTSFQEAPFRPRVIVFRKENRVWKKYAFSATDCSPDGNILYLENKYIERTDTGWSEIKSLGKSYEDIPIMRLTTSSRDTHVFDEFTRDGNGVLRYSQVVNGKREAPKPLDKVINTGKWNAHPFIAPDESYILWDSEREGGYGDNDLYISFKQKNGSWGPAINLGAQINSVVEENSARVTPDGKYLFFWRADEKTREDGSKYWVASRHWVSTQVIENLRPKN